MKTAETDTVTMKVYSPDEQGNGAFDGGKITEIKPIPFPQESGGSRRLGPMMYWAWATAHGDGVIGLHPHQGFEIMSYVLDGAVGHTDTGGNSSRVGKGGAQVMQTGSGISHQEEMHGERTDFFQIWFEPNMRESLQKEPTYGDYEHGDFPVSDAETGVKVKHVLGGDAPIQLDAQGLAVDVTLAPGASHVVEVPAHHALASVMIEGGGGWSGDALDVEHAVMARDFALVKTGADIALTLQAGDDGGRVFNVLVPLRVEYPLQF